MSTENFKKKALFQINANTGLVFFLFFDIIKLDVIKADRNK